MTEKADSVEVDVEVRRPLNPCIVRSERPKSDVSMWRVLGRRIPSGELVFFGQMIVILCVVIASIYNLSVYRGGKQSELWTALLSSCLGYVLPNPRLKRQ